jgi:hypothetical protein
LETTRFEQVDEKREHAEDEDHDSQPGIERLMSFKTIEVAPREDEESDADDRYESEDAEVITGLDRQDHQGTEYCRKHTGNEQHCSFLWREE